MKDGCSLWVGSLPSVTVPNVEKASISDRSSADHDSPAHGCEERKQSEVRDGKRFGEEGTGDGRAEWLPATKSLGLEGGAGG